MNIPKGVVKIIHTNSSALRTTIVYGFGKTEGYGYPGGLKLHSGLLWNIIVQQH